jgi:hypothetical protein
MPQKEVAMSKHDHRVLKRFGETAGWLGIEFVDYLIVSTSDDLQRPLFHSWNAAGRPC